MKTPLVACALVAAALAYAAHPLKAGGQEAAELASEAKASLQSLMATVPAAKALASDAEAILVFPKDHEGRPRHRRPGPARARS